MSKLFSLSFKKKNVLSSDGGSPAAETDAANASMGVMTVSKSGDAAMPDKETVDAEFIKLLDELGLPKAAKEAAMKQTTEQKWAMIVSRDQKEAAKKVSSS